MVMYAKIRRMYFREHLNISEIKRRTSLSRNTIKKWLSEATEPQYQRRKRDGKLTPFEPMLKQALATDAHRPKRDRRTGLMADVNLVVSMIQVWLGVENFMMQMRESSLNFAQ
jgi:transposase